MINEDEFKRVGKECNACGEMAYAYISCYDPRPAIICEHCGHRIPITISFRRARPEVRPRWAFQG